MLVEASDAGPGPGALLDLQDGGVGLHDGHDDPVDVVLQAEVDLLLSLDSLHELWGEHRSAWDVPAVGTGGHGPYLVTGHGADLRSKGLREGRGEEAPGTLDAEGDDLPVELLVLLLQGAVVLETTASHGALAPAGGEAETRTRQGGPELSASSHASLLKSFQAGWAGVQAIPA